MASTVYIVHCIDTEGPLYESLDATFERLKEIFHIELQPSVELLRRLQRGEVDLGGLEEAVKRVVDPHLLAYNDTWDKVDAMLTDAMSTTFREKIKDSFGRGWIYNWFCVDHVDYEINPRRRDMGYHNIYDHYRGIIRDLDSPQDSVHLHYHPQPFRREAHRCATHWWAASNSLFQVLSRRVIDRQWFPVALRPGYHVIRPDSHWFLEQYMPFCYSNQGIALDKSDTSQFGLTSGRYGDWRRAPCTWEPYHPSHDDYQVPGDCRRWTARCLNVGTRYRLLTETDVRQAFTEAQSGRPVVLSVTNHDFRDMRPDIDATRELIQRVAADFPTVPYRFSEAVEAMRASLALPHQPPCELDIEIKEVSRNTHVLTVESKTPTFGPQPWLALKTESGSYHCDNFDIDIPFHRWQYVFDEDTFRMEVLNSIGVAANNAFGTTTVKVVDRKTGSITTKLWNEAS